MIASNYRKADAGHVAVEAAIIFSALLFLLFGIIEFGMAFWQWNTLTFAVEHAGRYMMVSGCVANNNCATVAENCMRGLITSKDPMCRSTAQISWISNPPPVCKTATNGTPPTTTITTPPASTACVYATFTCGSTQDGSCPGQKNPPNPPVPDSVTLVAEYNMDWTVLQSLTSLFSSTLNGPMIQAQVTVPLD